MKNKERGKQSLIILFNLVTILDKIFGKKYQNQAKMEKIRKL